MDFINGSLGNLLTSPITVIDVIVVNDYHRRQALVHCLALRLVTSSEGGEEDKEEEKKKVSSILYKELGNGKGGWKKRGSSIVLLL